MQETGDPGKPGKRISLVVEDAELHKKQFKSPVPVSSKTVDMIISDGT